MTNFLIIFQADFQTNLIWHLLTIKDYAKWMNFNIDLDYTIFENDILPEQNLPLVVSWHVEPFGQCRSSVQSTFLQCYKKMRFNNFVRWLFFCAFSPQFFNQKIWKCLSVSSLMFGSCHFNRVSIDKFSVEFWIFGIVIFFNCGRVLKFGAPSR